MTKAKGQSLPYNLPPAALSRDAAADFLGIGASSFEKAVADGLMPSGKRIGGRKLWLVLDLEKALRELPYADEEEEEPRGWEGVDLDR